MSRWAAAFRATLAPSVAAEPSPLADAPRAFPDDLCDASAMRAEPRLPPIASPERDRGDREHKAMVTGLRAAAMRRPPSWWNPMPHNPTPGSACFCCFNRHWWTSDRLGWCCWTCHPPPLPLPARMTVVEVVT